MRIARGIGGTIIFRLSYSMIDELKDVAYLDSKIKNFSVETKKFKNETLFKNINFMGFKCLKVSSVTEQQSVQLTTNVL